MSSQGHNRDLFTRLTSSQYKENLNQMSESQDLLHSYSTLDNNSQSMFSTPIHGFPLTPVSSNRSHGRFNVAGSSVGHVTSDLNIDMRMGIHTILNILRDLKPKLSELSKSTDDARNNCSNVKEQIMNQIKEQINDLFKQIERTSASNSQNVKEVIEELLNKNERSRTNLHKTLIKKNNNLIKRENTNVYINIQQLNDVVIKTNDLIEEKNKILVNKIDELIASNNKSNDDTNNILTEMKRLMELLDSKLTKLVQNTSLPRCSPVAAVRPQPVMNNVNQQEKNTCFNEQVLHKKPIFRNKRCNVRRTPVFIGKTGKSKDKSMGIFEGGYRKTQNNCTLPAPEIRRVDINNDSPLSEASSTITNVESIVDMTAVLHNRRFFTKISKFQQIGTKTTYNM